MKTADVLVENYRPGAFEALGLGYEDLRKINPKLIYASFSAFGQGGPKRERTAYDHVIQSTSGIMAMTGTPEVNPIKIGAPAIDYATGTMGAYALSAALFQRERTGEGQRVDMAMLDVAMILMASHVTGYLRNGKHPKPSGNRMPHATSMAYQTAEGMLMIGASNLRQQKRLWTVLERPDLIKRTNDERDADHDREVAGAGRNHADPDGRGMGGVFCRNATFRRRGCARWARRWRIRSLRRAGCCIGMRRAGVPGTVHGSGCGLQVRARRAARGPAAADVRAAQRGGADGTRLQCSRDRRLSRSAKII